MKSKTTIKDELFDFIKDNIETLYNGCLDEIKCKSIVTNNEYKKFIFVGSGCGITYLKYRKSKKAIEIDEASHVLHDNEVLKILIDKLPSKDYNYLKSIGCPFEAIWWQMQKLQIIYYALIVKFAETKGITMKIVSHID
jgi:hypothetical protein